MQTVFVGLSGGVDSAVSAALLQEQGYEVVGAFIKIWQPEFTQCSWREDRLDAMRVAARLGIPFREVDLSDEYQREVVERMVAEYARGITPNPDVLCNRAIKFGHFARWAFSEGADRIATGHYARISHSDMRCRYELLRGADASKDQSYFLYRLTQDDLARTLFPVGAMQKSEVRALAERFELPVARKRDSQGLCFVGEVTLEDFLSRLLPLREGAVLDMQGERVGTHKGAALYTLGQRHGYGVSGEYATRPHYVVGVDIEHNVIRISASVEDAARDSVVLRDATWIHRPTAGARYRVQARYRETPVPATLSGADLERVRFERPHIAVSGQSLVVYDGDACLGGGVIA